MEKPIFDIIDAQKIPREIPKQNPNTFNYGKVYGCKIYILYNF